MLVRPAVVSHLNEALVLDGQQPINLWVCLLEPWRWLLHTEVLEESALDLSEPFDSLIMKTHYICMLLQACENAKPVGPKS